MADRKSIADRFNEKVDRSGGPAACWPWTGGKTPDGYGRLAEGRPSHRVLFANRVAWELAYGPIPEHLCALHRCDNPPCCNPTHLFLGTRRDNCLDMYAKGRSRKAQGEDHPNSRFTVEQVAEIRRLYVKSHRFRPSETDSFKLAKRFGTCQSVIMGIVRGKSWRVPS